MRGQFDQILGKTITDVYCRKNKSDPEGQIFLVFDDETYFEIYAYRELKGANGIDKGDLNTVINLNSPVGKEYIYRSAETHNKADQLSELQFDLSDDDKFLIEVADTLAVKILKSKNLSPRNIISIGKFLYVLRRLPHQTNGSTYIDLTLSSHRGGETNYLSFQVSETQFEVTKGGSDGYSEIDWFVDIDGRRETDGDIYRLEDTILECLNLGYEISIEDESDLVLD